ncbi:SAM hydrolase/SAM-dependent halogenase family protein [Aliterella atlantica]|uniref:SAM-dependent chlorinase/fluorinase n=1 Tax=Aliterella atlantica CENA595 TaxID=1618023 RepID=A0A0D8ZU95_9CYAN|nr:SAM-dependent chlorinase/fluorinase [Aliterella atlantica]KJH72338.1 hypothetical protein UH38_07950 [Aliterella atlantica CENA595]
MQPNGILTLLSDFGLSDVYVGVIKGAIAQINPALNVIDLTHQIPPQSIAAARFCLMNAYAYFPSGTVHIAVVDPGVGSTRRAIAVEFAQGYLVGPDNGLFSGVLSQSPAFAAVELTNPQYWRTTALSNTFHGRDIFAPVGAHLASGANLTQLGENIDVNTLVQLDVAPVRITPSIIYGCIQYIDGFGNSITNISGSYVQQHWNVIVNGLHIPGSNTYSDVVAGNAIALVGSHGYVEIAIANGNACRQLQLKLGTQVQVLIR